MGREGLVRASPIRVHHTAMNAREMVRSEPPATNALAVSFGQAGHRPQLK